MFQRMNARDKFGNSPLHTAIRKGEHDTVEYLLSAGADILGTNAKGETALHIAVSSSFMEKPHDENITRKLIEMGANVNSKDSNGRSPLHLAVRECYPDKRKTVDILIKAGASVTDVDLQGMNPIHHFIKIWCHLGYSEDESFFEYIDLLVINDSAANSKNAIGQNILHLAILADAPLQVLEYLVQKGCSPTTEDGQKRNLLHCIVEGELEDFVDILDFLLDKGLNINNPDIWGRTVLHYAVEENNKKLVKALFERGADVNVKDSVGRQPLHIAAERGCDVICDLLIKLGANINARDKHMSTPLHQAAWTNEGRCVAHVLIKAGCDVELRDACGQTAEEVANYWSCFDFLQQMRKENNLQLEQKLLAKHGGGSLELQKFQDVIDSSERLLNTSGTLNEFLSCLISTPGIGTDFEDPEAGEIREVVDRFATNIVKRIADNNPKMCCTLYHVGSSAEGTKTKHPDEFDYVVCFDELSKSIYPKHETDDVLESVILVSKAEMTSDKVEEVLEEGTDYEETLSIASVSNYARIFLKDDTRYEYSEFTDLEPKLIPNCLMLGLFTQQLSNIVFDENFPKDERLVMKDVTDDPKLSLLWRGSRYKTLEIEVDFVPAVRLPSWPDKFRIQSQLFDPDLLHLPCLAVPKMSGKMNQKLWRVSLCLVETAIMNRCLHRMRNSYIAAKSLINSAICPFILDKNDKNTNMMQLQYVSEHDSVSSDEDLEAFVRVEDMVPSYILKMAFFHSLEEKAAKDGVETVFNKYNAQQSNNTFDIATCEEPDPEIVKDIFMKCEAWLSNQFVPSFFNPRQNVMGSGMKEENGVNAKMYIKYILKLLNEKC